MDIELEPGTYVVAVSGGVDSMVLLDLLIKKQEALNYQHHRSKQHFIVAHFDHGIREDSSLDRRLVQGAAKAYGLPFVYHEGRLGQGASEATARQARYNFLHTVRQASGGRAIVTGHHQDDAIETALINVWRGTGRKGFSSLRSTDVVKRPLLKLTKSQLNKYAQANQLLWREDSTNQDQRYLRNYLRHQVIPRLTGEQRQTLLGLIERMHELNDEVDRHLLTHLHVQPALDRLDRHHFIMLPHAVGLELMAAWLRQHGSQDFDAKTLQRLSLAVKSLQPGRLADVNAAYLLQVNKHDISLLRRPAAGRIS